MLFLGIDFGTSGVRALAVDGDGRIRGQGRAALPEAVGEDGWREQDPALWLEALTQALAQLAAQVGDAWRQVTALAIDGTSATLVPADARGRPLRPALMYHDQRARAEAQMLAGRFPGNGALAGASASLAKLLWLARHEPAMLAGLRHLHHQADWIAAQLTGCWGRSDPGNALKLGLDAASLRWPGAVTNLLEAAGIDPACLPRIVPSGEVFGALQPAWAEHLDLPAGLSVLGGTTDSLAALIAAGVRTPGQAASSLGSTLVLKLAAARPLDDLAAGIYSHRLGTLWLPGGASNAGGAALLRHFSPAEMEALTLQLRPERPTGWLCYPLPAAGERFPLNDPAFAGTPPPAAGPLTRFQALLEGLSYIEAWGYRRLAMDAPPQAVLTLGGGTRNAAWMQLRANVLGRPVLVPDCPEAALGAAMLAAVPQFGTLAAAQGALAQPCRRFEPEPWVVPPFQERLQAFIDRFAPAHR